MSLLERLNGAYKPLAEKLADMITGSYEVEKTGGSTQKVTEKPNIFKRVGGKKTTVTQDYIPKDNTIKEAEQLNVPEYKQVEPYESPKVANPRKENLFNKARAKVENLFDGNEQEASVLETQPEVVEPVITQEASDNITEQPRFTKDSIIFQEHGIGDGLPYLKQEGKKVSLKELYKTYQLRPLQKPINKITINDPEEGTYVIDTPEKLSIAHEIKAIADEIAPEYTNYLLKLAQKEGGYKRDAFRAAKDNPGGGDDMGIFQINSKSFPSVTRELANDVRFATLWAIALINSANPKKGDNVYSGQEKWMANESVKRSSINIE